MRAISIITISILILCICLVLGTFFYGLDNKATRTTVENCIKILETTYHTLFFTAGVTLLCGLSYFEDKTICDAKESFLLITLGLFCIGVGLAIELYPITLLEKIF